MLGHLQGLKSTLLSALHSPNYKPSSTRKLDRFKSISLIYHGRSTPVIWMHFFAQ